MFTDTSHLGWGAVSGLKEAAGPWNLRMSLEHSNYQELMVVLMALKSFGPSMKEKSIQILSDNVTTVAYINHLGGPNSDLTDIAKAIWKEAYELQIFISAKHLQGWLNCHADVLSRLSHQYEWQLHPKLFHLLDPIWGRHIIDHFATMNTTQLPKYNSRFLDPFSSGIDALAQQDWDTNNNFINAPFRLIPKILSIIKLYKAEATIISPHWPAQPWF